MIVRTLIVVTAVVAATKTTPRLSNERAIGTRSFRS